MKRLYRSRKNKVFAGICGGMGEYFDIDPVIIRIITAVLILFTGVPLFIYIVAIFVIPLEPLEGAEAAAQPVEVEKAARTTNTVTNTRERGGTRMEEHVKILGILYIAFSAFGLIIAFIVFVAVTGGGLISGDETAIAITSIVGIAVAAILVLLSAPGIIGGMGLLKRQSWARILVLVLGVINLINIPFGTALGIYTIWALTHRETEALFRNEE
jgi:phage shock protein PspC (stress-responsive transcriptional regulator)